jgi:hypothetical protein
VERKKVKLIYEDVKDFGSDLRELSMLLKDCRCLWTALEVVGREFVDLIGFSVNFEVMVEI